MRSMKGKVYLFLVFVFALSFSIVLLRGSLSADSTIEEDKKVMLPMTTRHHNQRMLMNKDFVKEDFELAELMYSSIINSSDEEVVFDGEWNHMVRSFDILQFKYGYYSPITGSTQGSYSTPNGARCSYTFKVDKFKESLKENERVKERVYEILRELKLNSKTTVYEAIDKIDSWLVKNVEFDYTEKANTI